MEADFSAAYLIAWIMVYTLASMVAAIVNHFVVKPFLNRISFGRKGFQKP